MFESVTEVKKREGLAGFVDSVVDTLLSWWWRIAFYGFALVWILLQPTFERESEHFGWGFLPRIASLFIVPIILGALDTDSRPPLGLPTR